jgi:putative SOS response-associated peptidase YedK
MCGRFSLFHNAEEIRRRFGLRKMFREWVRRYNIAPAQQILIVRREGGENVAEEVAWGLVPRWANAAKPVINARAESLAGKPTFQDSFRGGRCLIVADGFYEWQKQGAGKQPYRIALEDGGLFAMAGVYDDWRGRRAAAIVTVEANEAVKPIHERMPAMLSRQDEDAWLSPEADGAGLMRLLGPYAGGLTVSAITARINSPENEGEEVIRKAHREQARL